MDTLHFGHEYGKPITAYGSIRATVVHLLRSTPVFAVTIYLEPHGVLGMHPATTDQLFLVVAGSGQAVAGGARCKLSPGTAVFWHRGEDHETRAGGEGLVAVVLEGESLAEALSADFRGTHGEP